MSATKYRPVSPFSPFLFSLPSQLLLSLTSRAIMGSGPSLCLMLQSVMVMVEEEEEVVVAVVLMVVGAK